MGITFLQNIPPRNALIELSLGGISNVEHSNLETYPED